MYSDGNSVDINPSDAELNPICHLLVLLGAHHILHVSRVKVEDTGHSPPPSIESRLRMSGVVLPHHIRHHVVDRDNFIFTFTKSLFGTVGFEVGVDSDCQTRVWNVFRCNQGLR